MSCARPRTPTTTCMIAVQVYRTTLCLSCSCGLDTRVRCTRTARIRLVLDNPSGALKPDMYAEVKLRAELGRRLMVPEGAVLVAGESRVVFKDLGEDGKLKPVRVKTGQRVDGWVEIRQGLDPGDDVITSGNFLIAAEAKLKTGIEQW